MVRRALPVCARRLLDFIAAAFCAHSAKRLSIVRMQQALAYQRSSTTRWSDQARIVGPSTSSGRFAFWDVRSTTPVGEVVVMTDLVALLTLANKRLLVPWLALSSAQPMGVCECTPSATDCCLRIASVREC
jgi:hypothetical protein